MTRTYYKGRCEDCGCYRNVTRIKFWLNGYEMNVCSNCIRPYRKTILDKTERGIRVIEAHHV